MKTFKKSRKSSENPERLRYQIYRGGRQSAGYDFPIDAIAWIGRAPIAISILDRDLSLHLKSLSPHQPPGWNDPYRTREF